MAKTAAAEAVVSARLVAIADLTPNPRNARTHPPEQVEQIAGSIKEFGWTFPILADMHDGGVIVAGDRIVAARCLFPLSQQAEFSRALGTRHRAAVGLSDETDAIAVVVSEETGTISIAHRGRLIRRLDSERLLNNMRAFMTSNEVLGRQKSWLSYFKLRKSGQEEGSDETNS